MYNRDFLVIPGELYFYIRCPVYIFCIMCWWFIYKVAMDLCWKCLPLKMHLTAPGWISQTFDFSLGHDLRVLESSSTSSSLLIGESLSLSLPLCLLSFSFLLPLSQINKTLLKCIELRDYYEQQLYINKLDKLK